LKGLFSFPVAVLLVTATHSPRCGPTEEELGRAVMVSAPGVLLAAFGMMALLVWLWRKLEPEFSMKPVPILAATGAAALGAVLALIGMRGEATGTPTGVGGVVEWVPMALWAVGATYLLLLLITWRIWLLASPRHAFTWSFLPPLILVFLPAPLMALGWTDNWDEFCSMAWVFPGYLGAVTGPLLLLAIVEVVIRRKRAKGKQTVTEVSPSGE
jgi:hypothetical protein